MSKIIIEENEPKIIVSTVFSYVLVGLLGCILLFLPNVTNKLLGIIVGGLILTFGGNILYKSYKNKTLTFSFSNVIAAILAFLGLYIIIFPYTVSSFIINLLGFILIFRGFSKLRLTYLLRSSKKNVFYLNLFFSIAMLIFGILVIANPFSFITITRLVGLALLIGSILEIIDLVIFKKNKVTISKIK